MPCHLQVGAIQVGVLDLYRDTRSELAAFYYANGVTALEMVTAILLSGGRGDVPLESLGSLWDPRELARFTGQPGWSSHN